MLVRIIVSIAFVFSLSSCATTNTIDVVGDWSGTVDLGVAQLRLVFHITESEDGYTTTIESLDQGNAMIPTEIVLLGDSLTFTVESLNVEYKAIITGDEIKGIFTQLANVDQDFTLTRN